MSRINNTLSNKNTELRFVKYFRKTHLDTTETFIITILLYADLYDKRHYASKGDIIKIISMGDKEKSIQNAKYLSEYSKLFEKHIIYKNRSDYYLESKISSYLLGISKLKQKKNKAIKTGKIKSINSPRLLKTKLDEYIVGQEDAKCIISTAIFNHFKRIALRKDGKNIGKTNILLIGPTGCGKTHLCRTISNILNMPFVVTDATLYTETGYVGKDVTDMLRLIIKAAGNNIELASKGIIYIDEIDKIARRDPGGGHYTGRDVSGESVQQELLKLLEGDTLSLESMRASIFDEYSSKNINIRDLLFIAGGVFEGLENIIANRLKKQSSIGFTTENLIGNNEKADFPLLKHLITDDLIEFGMIPEFIGRFPVIVVLDSLDKDSLVRILTEPKDAIAGQYRHLMKASGINMTMDKGVFYHVAEEALKLGTGARGLRSIFEKIVSPIIYKYASNSEPPESVKLTVEDFYKEIKKDESKVA